MRQVERVSDAPSLDKAVGVGPIAAGFPGNDHTIRVTVRTADQVEVFAGTARAVPLVVDYPSGDRCSVPINVISVKAEGRSTLEVLAPQ